MPIQSRAEYQQGYPECVHSLDNSFSSMYQPQAQDPTKAHNPSCFEIPFDKHHMRSGSTNESSFDNLKDTEAWINQSMAAFSAPNEFCQGISEVPSTIQCDPWCSAAKNRQVQFSDVLSGDHALAKCGAKPLFGNSKLGYYHNRGALPDVMPHYLCSELDSCGRTPTTAATGDLAGSTRTKDEVKYDQLQRISWGSASVENSHNVVHTPWYGNKTSSYPCPLIPKDNGTFLEHEGSGFAPHSEGEQSHALNGEPKAERLPYGHLLPSIEFPVKDDYLHGIPLGVVSPSCPDGLAYTPCYGDPMSLNSSLSIPKYDDDTFLGYKGPRSVPYSDGEQNHALKGELKAERWPPGCLLPSLGFPVKDDYLHGISLGVVSPNCPDGLAYMPCHGDPMSLSSSPFMPKDDDAFQGYKGPRSAPYSDGEQSHALNGELIAERLPYGYHVPIGYSPVCKSNRRHKRRCFTKQEKMIISYKRKVGVCRDCRHAKRKCIHVQLDMGNEVTKRSGVINTRPRGASAFDGSETT